jgi:glyoxylase-like metal-dependent hydrolase (beta-lactamase superfamily II)/rhodanese-related sulfurtransferase
MEFKQFYLGCLAHASYLVGDGGEAAVIDPRRDVDEYLDEARQRGLVIRYVVETHLHADFVSGHRELAERTGAEVVFGVQAAAAFPHRAVKDGDEIRLGRLVLRFLETPGHTPESVTVLVIDPALSDEPRIAFTGDTLFIGDVGRPDLAGAKGASPEQMAGMLYDSLHGKLLTLPDSTEVYPAHGAGSLCGRNISKETSSTIGEQRQTNYALQPMSKARFIEMTTADLPEVPRYFALDVALNREGAAPLGERPLPKALSPTEVSRAFEAGAVSLDVRSSFAFGAGHVPGSLNVGLEGQFASWCGTLLEASRDVVLVTEDEEQVRHAATRLARVGFEHVAGYLAGGVAAWDRAGLPLARLPQWSVDALRAELASKPGLLLLDVRRPAEYATGHALGAVNLPLDRLEAESARLDTARPIAVICAGGYRSSAGTSVLQRRGFRELYNVIGGTSAWLAAGFGSEAG